MRPRWHWIFIGAGFVVTLWAPFSMLAGAFASGVLQVVALLFAYALACCLAALLVVRFGAAGVREAVGAGLVASFVLFLLTLFAAFLPPGIGALALVVLSSVAALACWAGARLGAR